MSSAKVVTESRYALVYARNIIARGFSAPRHQLLRDNRSTAPSFPDRPHWVGATLLAHVSSAKICDHFRSVVRATFVPVPESLEHLILADWVGQVFAVPRPLIGAESCMSSQVIASTPTTPQYRCWLWYQKSQKETAVGLPPDERPLARVTQLVKLRQHEERDCSYRLKEGGPKSFPWGR